MKVLWLYFGWAAMAVAFGAAPGQTPTPPPQTAKPATAKPSAAKPVKPSSPTANQAVQRIPIESAPATPATPASAEQQLQQKAADQKLLEQQQAQSAAAAQVTNAIVDKAQTQKDKIQNEVRIQDAPGPAQTGIVPAAGPPVVPAKSSQDIQEAPGPAQTLNPAPAAAVTPPPV